MDHHGQMILSLKFSAWIIDIAGLQLTMEAVRVETEEFGPFLLSLLPVASLPPLFMNLQINMAPARKKMIPPTVASTSIRVSDCSYACSFS